MKRLDNLDYLRGLSAFSIMIYHYFKDSHDFTSADFMGRIGIYGVAIFYILSGLTLFIVNENRITSKKNDLLLFAKKRVFRIFPLLWLVTIITIVLSKQTPDLTKLFLNLTGLFGFLDWDSYFARGAWSIGNELVFYVFFPFLIIALKKSKLLFIVLSTIIFSVYLHFSFNLISPNLELAKQWSLYVNPLNQAFLFLGGIIMGILFKKTEFSPVLSTSILITGLTVFIFYPAFGDQSTLITGINRLIFTFSCLFICLGSFKLTYQLHPWLHKPLAWLGEASYSVYLLHTLALSTAFKINRLTFNLDDPYVFVFAIILTLVASYFVYKYYEKYFIKIGSTKALKPQYSMKS